MLKIDVKNNTCIYCINKVNDKDPKFQIGDHVRISKCKNIFAKGHTQNQSFVIKLKNTVKNTV